MADTRQFYVGTQYGPDHKQPARYHLGAHDAIAAAIKQGAPCTVYLFDGRAKHWHLIVDYSTRCLGRIGDGGAVRSVIGRPLDAVECESVRLQVGSVKLSKLRASA